ncbi:ATP-binding protein [Rubrivirga sp.]|uniref:ATP-binding protein n=1 Tax=Rubrivirga sp. TaxID=1885344 RepID=UPI003B51FAE1
MPTYAFTDLDRAVDRLHAVCDGWAGGGPLVDILGVDGLHVLRLTLHEWVANLVQHAAFGDDREIVLAVEADGDAVRCAVEDTSAGFDFADQIEQQRALLNAPGPSERGRGLLMLVTCAEELEYRPAGPRVRQRLAFAMRNPAGSSLAGLFRPADLATDPSLVRSMGDGHSCPPAPAASPPPTR